MSEDIEELLPEEADVENELEEIEDGVQQEENEEKHEEENEVEEKAKKFGHISKEDWIASGKDPSKYKTPAEFNKTGEEIESRYTALKKKVDQRDREIQALIEYQQRTAQREFERAKQELEQRLASSKDDMDVEGVAHYTKELTRLQDSENQTHAQQMQQLQREAQEAFLERNAHWFNDRNPDLKSRAIEIDNELKEIYPNATYEELAKKIETRMQYEHPDRVLGQVKSRPITSPGTSSINKTAVKSSVSRTFQNLSQDLKDTYSAYKRVYGKEMSEAEFIERLKNDGELV